ncbi:MULTISPECIES: ATP-binding protein [unclassified Novosphingobium]|uniref:ATP-binding protein n=1 Tax=unclassified Novosphingobium TaxID=2644732 RepID=UPI000D46AFF8|nr:MULTISPECIES: ATP-binding protein [unclassified Novosphingobium]PTR09265.1 histidine kinase/DNA gyrase B/HSP90-like ATPase [Novosphingobium sp. GV055]PUB02116.1 histidine kinase/DNA gyrase B/HSP90-like ATPase [Novosphingobium sp. GV061]PUB18297.1 histidine kinase/DNA gyrase B/HSP90-like ATPase [Novosphingobium sp. GV079]PUB40549.1 histidine kinase/DNA gyrase B/HSP90-like ATPase [Novosphingobium sp. GV027]
MTFTPFDPLEFKNTKINEAAIGALKREIGNILSSYVGWYDPFAELIQNALDAVEARAAQERAASSSSDYKPTITVIIDLDDNALTVTDNGIGLDKEKFEQFLAPNFSFKTGKTRGHKGVGATYVAYGFNYMRISTRVPGFEASGRIIGARNWLHDSGAGGNPKIEPDNSPHVDLTYDAQDRGVSITVRFDDSTHPRRLDWIKADNADKWAKILAVKTGLGSIIADEGVAVTIRVIAAGNETVARPSGTAYLWLHKSAGKVARVREVETAAKALFEKFGSGRALPDKYRNLDFVHDSWNATELELLIGSSLDPEEKEILARYTPSVSVEFGYTAKLWTKFNESLELRLNYRVLNSGIQLAANNMPQGETILIPLTRNIGRQNQLHFLIHFDNYSPDMGRKGFHRELTDFAKTVARLITENHLAKIRHLLKANTGVAPDLVRELKISDWKKEMLAHERASPLSLSSEHFFKPTERVSVTSAPTREQDVIALFNQLIAGGVVRGIRVMSTNERFTYDGLFKVVFDLDQSLYIYDGETNPLGVSSDIADALHGRITDPQVLEYKFCLDGLIEDFDSQDKNINDVNLAVFWETGTLYKERFGITSLLVPENADQRQYHGLTHVLTDLESGAKLCDLIVLEELIASLNDPVSTAAEQREKYE